jgi:DNA polymerase-1
LPEKVVDVLSLVGDASDNVPGVPGIGDKGARALIAEFGSLEALLDRAAEVKRKSYRENLQEHRDQALMSRDLVTIHTDLPVPFEPEDLRRDPPDWTLLLDLLHELDFTGLRRELEDEHGRPVTAVAAARDVETASAWCEAVPADGRICVAVVGEPVPIGLVVGAADGGEAAEAGSPDEGAAEAGSDSTEEAWLADFRRPEMKQAALARLATWAADEDTTLIGHDIKETLRLLSSGGVVPTIACRLVDTMLLSYLVEPSRRGHGLAEVSFDRLRHEPMKPAAAGWEKDSDPLVGIDCLAAFAAERVVLPLRMCGELAVALDEGALGEGALGKGSLRSVYDQIEAPLVPVLLRMEEAGIALDGEVLAGQSRELGKEIDALETEIYDLAGERFNVNSPQQLGVILFEKLDYPVLKRTRKTRGYATGAEVLEELAGRGYPLPVRMLRYRELSKLRSTYLDALPALVASDGRLHSRFNQAVATTGRLSSSNPNLQNIPVRTPQGEEVRKAFVAPPGRQLVVADYSQIELRVLAHVAGEQTMIDAFASGTDIHTATAAKVFDMAPLLVSSDQRRMAKTINFGILYGMSSWGLAQRLGISKAEAEKFIKTYKAQYPAVARFTEEVVETAKETGRVATLYGRIRTLPDIKSRNYNLREGAKRRAINAPIQGTAADLMKIAMIAVDRRLAAENPRARLILTVHDELIIEVPEADAPAVAAVVKEEMEGVADLVVPLEVDLGIGTTWYDAKA